MLCNAILGFLKNLNFNVRLLSETWEPVKCSTCTSPNTVYVENGGKLFPSPRMPENDLLPLHFHFPLTNLRRCSLSDFCWHALNENSGTKLDCSVISRPLIWIKGILFHKNYSSKIRYDGHLDGDMSLHSFLLLILLLLSTKTKFTVIDAYIQSLYDIS